MGTILGHSQIVAHHLNKKNEYEMGHQPKKSNFAKYTLLYADFQVDFISNLPIILPKMG